MVPQLNGARVALACALAAMVVGVAGIAPARAETTQTPEPADAPKVLLYGDSTVQGTSADWTWRYRLWQSLTYDAGSVDLVGPRTDLVTYTTLGFGNQEYRNPAFDTDHAGVAGQKLSSPALDASRTVESTQADVLVGLIGVNDLLQQKATPAQLVDLWRTEITQAREVRPGLSVVLTQLPQTWHAGVPAYNEGLAALAAELDRPEARVVLATPAAFNAWWDTFDHTHFTASGERKVADAVATALQGIGIGTGPHKVADPAPTQSWAPTPSVTLSGTNMLLSWTSVDFASSQDVWFVDITNGQRGVLQYRRGTSLWLPGQAGHVYALRVAPVKGYLEIGTSSPWIWVQVPAAAPAPSPTPTA